MQALVRESFSAPSILSEAQARALRRRTMTRIVARPAQGTLSGTRALRGCEEDAGQRPMTERTHARPLDDPKPWTTASETGQRHGMGECRRRRERAIGVRGDEQKGACRHAMEPAPTEESVTNTPRGGPGECRHSCRGPPRIRLRMPRVRRFSSRKQPVRQDATRQDTGRGPKRGDQGLESRCP